MISVVILGYNSAKYLKDCFNSLKQLEFNQYNIIYVDNNSQDESVMLVRHYCPQATVIINKENFGFAKGNNIGIKAALKAKADYVFLLNPDTVIDNTCLTKLIQKADDNTILQPLLLIFDKKKTDFVNSSGNYVNYLGISYCGDYMKKAQEISVKNIPSATGAALFLPKKIIERVGMFDENFFMYHEDLDLCWRARREGFEVKVIPSAKVWHKYQFSRHKEKFFYVERNRLLFVFKNFDIKTLLLIWPMLLIQEILTLCYAIINGWVIIKLRAWYSFLKLLPQILSQRKKISRKVNDHTLKKYLNPDIQFSEIQIPGLAVYNLVNKAYWALVRQII